MNNEKTVIEPIGIVKSDFNEKFGLPRQSGRAPSLVSKIVINEKFSVKEAFFDLKDFSHVWVIFDFTKAHKQTFSPTVRPPRLGGNKRVGVFSTRSPFRPNNLGLSSCRLLSIEYGENVVLTVSGLDVLNGSTVYDIKPYIKYTDCHSDAISGFAEDYENYKLTVNIPENLKYLLPNDKIQAIIECLEDDPRPSYIDDESRIYKMKFSNYDISFTVKDNVLTVTNVLNLEK